MKRLIFVLVLISINVQIWAIIEENADLFNFFFFNEPNCAYSKWESHIVEGIAQEGYNMYAPYDRQTEGFGQFTLPTEAQTDIWEEGVDLFFEGNYNAAHILFSQNNIPYSVVKFTDGSDIYYMLRENLNLSYMDDNGTGVTYDDEIGSFDFGWGIFVYRTTNPNPVIVTAPHPNDDFVTPYLSVKSFMSLDAQYLMINGSGREVMWSEYGNYSNNKSLSDPSRNCDHPFNYFYAKAADKIREDYERRELSVQLHSYDWDTHPGMASCQISPGQYRRPAGLPIRDFSPLRQDVIQNTDYLVIPQGSIGINEEVTVEDYYSVHNLYYPTTYHDTLIISNDVDLPGYPNSFHDIYSTSNFSDWDVFSPFFHVEFDELPNCYLQSEESFKTFYGFNSYTYNWNISEKYTKMDSYYQPFIAALAEAVEAWVEFDDQEIPEAPSNLRRNYVSSGNSIAWDPAPCYDFYSYEILYSLTPISQGDYSVIDRDLYSALAFPINNSASLNNLQLNQTYYIAMRTLDYNGNISPVSEELVYTTLPITTSDFSIYADNNSIEIEWTQIQQQNCSGFEIYRKTNAGEFELHASYIDNPELVITNSYYDPFSYTDTNLEIDEYYSYRVNVVTSFGQSNQISQIINGALANYIQLNSVGNSWNETITFGKSYFATDGYDESYDQLRDGYYDHLCIEYNNEELVRNIIPQFDETEEVRYLDLNIYNPPTSLTFSLDNSRNSERFYLIYDNELYSLNSSPIQLNFPGAGTFNAKLVWGNLQAKVTFPDYANSLLYQGDDIEMEWDIDYPELVQSIDLNFMNEFDVIPIVENLPADQTSYTFTNNISQDSDMMNLVVKVTSIDDQIIDFKSFDRFIFVSEIEAINIDSSSNNKLISYPFTSSFYLNTIAGNIEAFSLNEQEFLNVELLDNDKGYFLNILEDCQLDYNGSPFLADTQYEINRGWNLIYNPHPVDYKIENILFYRNNSVRSFKRVAESELIMPQIIGIRDGGYTPVDTLKAFESVFLNQLTTGEMYVRFEAVNLSEDFSLSIPEIYFTLEFITSSGAKDELRVGLQSGLTPIMDVEYDLMKAPVRPTSGITEAYIVSQAPLSNYYPKMHTKLIELTQADTYYWEIAFTNTLTQPVQVRIKESNNPYNYPLDLHLGTDTYRLTNNFMTIANTDLAGTYAAELSIMTITENENHDVQLASQFVISPNPIKEKAEIIVSNTRNKDFSLAIYNLKGQKVKDFNIEDCKTDNSVITWNLTNNGGNRVSSGVYFVKYQDSLKSHTKKICVIK
ncbi:T9SS type A sorting domain-containing protein [bacterium]|nr:T9SS type A sorting domain-containing protein [bacterium]